MMEYKAYLGRVEFDNQADLFHGEVINTRDVITFQGVSVDELKTASMIQSRITWRSAGNAASHRTSRSQFVTRVTPELHRQISVAAAKSNRSLNAWVVESLQTAVESSHPRLG